MRLAVTIGALLLGAIVVFAVWQGARQPDERPTPDEVAEQPGVPETAPDDDVTEPAPGPEPAEPVTEAPAEPETEPEPDVDLDPVQGLHIQEPDNPAPMTLGEADAAGESPYRMQVDLTRFGAGVTRIVLSGHREAVETPNPYVVHRTLSAPIPGTPPDEDAQYRIYPYAARSVTVNDETIDLQTASWSADGVQETDQGQIATYRLTLANADGQPVLELIRRYILPLDHHGVILEQQAVNRSDQPLELAWQQNIQGDTTPDPAAYMGDMRMFIPGYFNLAYDSNYNVISTSNAFLRRGNILEDGQIWPRDAIDPQARLAWLASENRYFAVITHSRVPEDAQFTREIAPLDDRFPNVGVQVIPDDPQIPADQKLAVFTLGTEPEILPPGQSADYDLSFFAGPRKHEVLTTAPYNLLQFDQLRRYELRGPCTFCTFQWLANFLLWFLTGIATILADWGVAIIILVLVVRLLLHPITKKAQINMMKMGKQMQALQPELEKLKKKYKDDQQKLNQEMMKLYREKGINPANMLGCLPMFLQMPIWIALYAMLYFAVELRHEPAFYGVFQHIGNLFGVNWQFLADLSTADHFITFPGEGFTLNLLFIHPTFAAFNLLPILMAVVFFVNQKLTMPPATTEQAAQQQKIMRVVILIFPIFLYSAPSGLTLYILASTFGGIVDSWIVRRHVNQLEEEGRLFEKKQRKEGGFMDRMMKAMEEKQKEIEALQQGKTQDADAKKPKGVKSAKRAKK